MDTGAAVIVCPGGGYRILAYDHEGTEVAEWLAKLGVTGIVLKYRVPARDENKRWRAAVQDAQRAMRVVREQGGRVGHRPEADRHPRLLGRRRDRRVWPRSCMRQSQYEAVDKRRQGVCPARTSRC